MRPRACVLALVGLLLLACDEDPARSMKIIARPAPKEEPAAPPVAATPAESTTVARPDQASKPIVGSKPDGARADVVKPGGAKPGVAKADGTPGAVVSTAAAPAAPDNPFQWRPNLCPPPPEPSEGSSALVVTGACPFRHRGLMKCSSSKDDFYAETRRPGVGDATMIVYVNVERYKGPGKYDKAEMLIGVLDTVQHYRWFTDEAHITVAEDEKSVEIQPVRLEPLPPVEAPDLEAKGTLVCRPKPESPSGSGG